MFAMIAAVVLLFLLCSTSSGAVEYKCKESGAPPSLTFTPAKDGVQGRYTVQLCTTIDPEVKLWNIDLFYFKDPARCHNKKLPDHMHSVLTKEPIENPFNCTNGCIDMDFDLIFAGCYNIHSAFETNRRKKRPEDAYVTVQNNLTLEIYKSNAPRISFIPDIKEVVLHWYLGLAVTDYCVGILKDDDSEPGPETDITKYCKIVKWNEVRCNLKLELGPYRAIFRHKALWSSVLNAQTDVSFNFNYTAPATPKLFGDTTFVWWVCGGALLAAAALFAAVMARKALRTRNYHKQVLKSWREARECENTRPLEPRPPMPNILVLYAREGEHGQRAVSALKTLIQQATGAQVLDMFSPEVSCLAAPAPGEWVRHTLLGAHTRVLLLQSPATQALFATNFNQNNLNLQEPLLGRRAMYRCPQFGDQLLLLALRLISETVAEHHDYSKYYLATYSSLDSDIVQQVVPYRRYVLPAAVTALLRDLAQNTDLSPAPTAPPTPPIEPDPALLQHFYDSVDRFVTHANDNPDYLMEELMIM